MFEFLVFLFTFGNRKLINFTSIQYILWTSARNTNQIYLPRTRIDFFVHLFTDMTFLKTNDI